MLKLIRRRILYSRAFRRLMAWSMRLVLPGFEGFSVYQIARFFISALANGQIIMRASAISFKLFLAFFPAVIVLLTLIPFVPIADFQERLLATFHDMMPGEVFQFIKSTLEDLVVKKHGTLLSVSFIVGIYLASNSIDAILAGFSGSANHTKWHSPLKQRLLSLGLLLALTVLTIIAIPLLTLGGIAINWLDRVEFFASSLHVHALFALKWLISILVVITFVSLLYNAGDPHARRFKWISPGVLLAVVLILVVSQALAYMFSNITDYNALYGSIGAILAVQFWIYLNMLAVLVGYELNTSIARARLKRSERLRLSNPAS
ncbi:MAG: YihY/virulence factor BrkB family protein [Flavobacteriales bacterium]|nr:YihY/virulence factor BrkB family protein [Flavobacteriales bacterium]